MKKIISLLLAFLLVAAFNFSHSAFAADKNLPKEKTKKNKKRKKASGGGIESAMIFEEPKVAVKSEIEPEVSETTNNEAAIIEPIAEESEVSSYIPEPETAIAIPNEHLAQKNENLYSIARKYNIPVADLILLNNLSSTEIKEGQRVVLTGNAAIVKKEDSVPMPKATIIESKTPNVVENTSPAINISPQDIFIGCYAVADEKAATIKVQFLKEKGYNANYFFIPDYVLNGKKLYRVFAGPFPDQKAAREALVEIQKFREFAYIFRVK